MGRLRRLGLRRSVSHGYLSPGMRMLAQIFTDHVLYARPPASQGDPTPCPQSPRGQADYEFQRGSPNIHVFVLS